MSEIVTKPWGTYETVHESDTYKVKKISINPNQSFSLQYHEHRHENWTIVEGSGTVINGEEQSTCYCGNSFDIPVKQIHRATAGDYGLVFIEVQRGYCNENDIVRLEDNYGRAN